MCGFPLLRNYLLFSVSILRHALFFKILHAKANVAHTTHRQNTHTQIQMVVKQHNELWQIRQPQFEGTARALRKDAETQRIQKDTGAELFVTCTS